MTKVLSIRYSEEELQRIKEVSKALNKDISNTIKTLNLYGLEKVAAMLYQEGRISLEKAAKLANLSLWEMIDLTRKMGIKSNITRELGKKGLDAVLEE
jgi:predicted HTH domain antitoxin